MFILGEVPRHENLILHADAANASLKICLQAIELSPQILLYCIPPSSFRRSSLSDDGPADDVRQPFQICDASIFLGRVPNLLRSYILCLKLVHKPCLHFSVKQNWDC